MVGLVPAISFRLARPGLRGDVLLALWDALKREKITFPSPFQEVRLRDATEPAAEVESYLARGGRSRKSG